MKKIVSRIFLVITLTSFIYIPAMISLMNSTASIPTNKGSYSMPVASEIKSNANWHEGLNISTPEVDVNYSEVFEQSLTYQDNMKQIMRLEYKDDSEVAVGFEIKCNFNDGGLDFINNQVLDWGKLTSLEPTWISSEYVNKTYTNTRVTFYGFYITNGTAADVKLRRQIQTDHMYAPENIEAWLSYRNATANISEVVLSTKDYMVDDVILKESIANFNVTFNATIGTMFTEPSALENIPVILTFQVNHNITHTTYKYGMDIDWSNHKDFPTGEIAEPLSTGDDFTLVADDRFDLWAGPTKAEGSGDENKVPFTSNTENDTLTFVKDWTELGFQHITTEYHINRTEPATPTTRLFIEEGIEVAGNEFPMLFTFFDGFKYNISTGISFDPEIVLKTDFPPNPNGDVLPPYVIPIICAAIGGVAIVSVLLIKKRKQRIVNPSNANTSK